MKLGEFMKSLDSTDEVRLKDGDETLLRFTTRSFGLVTKYIPQLADIEISAICYVSGYNVRIHSKFKPSETDVISEAKPEKKRGYRVDRSVSFFLTNYDLNGEILIEALYDRYKNRESGRVIDFKDFKDDIVKRKRINSTNVTRAEYRVTPNGEMFITKITKYVNPNGGGN